MLVYIIYIVTKSKILAPGVYWESLIQRPETDMLMQKS